MSLVRIVLMVLEAIAEAIKIVRINKLKGVVNEASKNKDQKSIDDLNKLAD